VAQGLYSQAGAEQEPAGAASGAAAGGTPSSDDDVVDAEFRSSDES
jgi:hypothetical protein